LQLRDNWWRCVKKAYPQHLLYASVPQSYPNTILF
jgi:hypothetical protein